MQQTSCSMKVSRDMTMSAASTVQAIWMRNAQQTSSIGERGDGGFFRKARGQGELAAVMELLSQTDHKGVRLSS
jgi:hypothetical protein